MEVLLIGVGPVGIEYGKIARALGHTVVAHGRGEAGCANFLAATGISAVPGGMDQLERRATLPALAIVAVSEAQLGLVVDRLVELGVKRILVEKPGAASADEITRLAAKATHSGCDIRVGYNRRFHASTLKAREIIAADGGVRTFHFEFTEWSHRIEPLQKEPGVKEEWFLHNSSHVVDLAFHLGGWPTTLHALTAGSLSWHRHARHVGSGATDSGALFSYFADWQGPGRWSVEMITSAHRLIFRPLEKLLIQQIGSVAQEPVEIDDRLDVEFKPGFYRQTQAFFDAPETLLSIQEQAAHLDVYASMNPAA
jgi:predicted dehydrogenase